MRLFYILLSVTTALWLTSCATTPIQKAPNVTTQTGDMSAKQLSALTSWNMTAVIGIQNLNPPDTISATLKWKQTNQQYTILLFGPLGAGTAQLYGNFHQASLQTSDGKTFTADSPEALLAQQTHWKLPVSNLYYWIRGLPVPTSPAEKQFDALHRLTQLSQQGWSIQYLGYTTVNQLDLPSKITLSHPALRVKIVIKRWEF